MAKIFATTNPEMSEREKRNMNRARRLASQGMVLLENNGVLPLKGVRNIAVYGCTSYAFIAGGTGSGDVNRAYTVSLLDGLKNAGFNVDESKKAAMEAYIAEQEVAALAKRSGPYASFMPVPRPEELIPAPGELAASAKSNDLAIITFGRTSGEFFDRSSADFSLTGKERRLLEAVTAAFHRAGKKVVVVLNVGGVVETASWKHIPDAILLAWQAGQEGGNSVADILTGVESPSGKLTMTFPLALGDAASSANFPIDLKAEIDFDGNRADRGEKDVDVTNYEEGIYVGYRWFEKAGKKVSYPFGYGLSYTAFDYSEAAVQTDGETVTATVKVTNSGSFPGKEVVQLYASAPEGKLDKPVKELKAFAKTAKLAPGESQTLTLSFPASELSSWDEGGWVLDKGSYRILLGASSADIRAQLTVEIN